MTTGCSDLERCITAAMHTLQMRTKGASFIFAQLYISAAAERKKEITERDKRKVMKSAQKFPSFTDLKIGLFLSPLCWPERREEISQKRAQREIWVSLALCNL